MLEYKTVTPNPFPPSYPRYLFCIFVSSQSHSVPLLQHVDFNIVKASVDYNITNMLHINIIF